MSDRNNLPDKRPITEEDNESQLAAATALWLMTPDVNNSTLANLSHKDEVAALTVGSATEVNDEGLTALAKLPNLVSLHLDSAHVSGRTLNALSQTKSLRDLSLAVTEADDQSMTAVATLHLTQLSLYNTHVGDRGINTLTQGAAAGELERLDLGASQVTDAAVTTLANSDSSHHLQWLNLSLTATTDASIDNLLSMKGLHYLDIRDTKISPRGATKLRFTLPECEIMVGDRYDPLSVQADGHMFFINGAVHRDSASTLVHQGETLRSIIEGAQQFAYRFHRDRLKPEIIDKAVLEAKAKDASLPDKFDHDETIYLPSTLFRQPPDQLSPLEGSKLTLKGDVSAKFARTIADYEKELPPGLITRLSKAGIQIRATSESTTAGCDIKDWDHARGHSANDHVELVNGFFDPTCKAVIIAERWARNQADTDHTYFHEVGHATDSALGNISMSSDFQNAYEQDISKINDKDKVRLDYFLQSGFAGREETAAEAFAIVSGHADAKDEVFSRAFPNVLGQMATLYMKLMFEQNSDK